MNTKKLFDLSERVVILTGAAGQLGTKYAEGLVQANAKVVLADIDFKKCSQLAKKLQTKYDCDIIPLSLDITNKKSVKNLMTKTIQKFSKIDVLINNVMFKEGKNERSVPFEKFPLSSWNKIFEVNLTGMFLTCQEIGKIMLKQEKGVIINISSIYGLVAADQRIYGKSGLNSSVAYSVTKSGVMNFSRYLASIWHSKGIRVNTITLGGVENNQDVQFIKNYSSKTMIGRMAHDDEYVGAILFLASDASSYMTGSNLIVDGGWTAW